MNSAWSESEARGKDDLGLLVYRSRLIGADSSLVLPGGGNTSGKWLETDFDGARVRVLRIKGSGADLRAATAGDFPALRIEPILALRARAALSDDEMVAILARCRLNPDSRRPSIETLLHAFLASPHVDHTHADAILALADSVDGPANMRRCFGEEAVWVPYRRPGFTLSKAVAEAAEAAPRARLAVLDRHGLVSWGDHPQECYERTVAACSRAEAYVADCARGRRVFGAVAAPAWDAARRRDVYVSLAPAVRGAIGVDERGVLVFDDSPEVLVFVGSEGARAMGAAGPATPDHVIHVKPRPLYVADPEQEAESLAARIRTSVAEYRRDYTAYVARHVAGRAPFRDASPRVLLVPGLGMIAAGRDVRSARAAAEAYRHTVSVMAGAGAVGGYRSLSEGELCDVEYWPLEQYRVALTSKARALEGRVALITGAASGLGRAIARRLAAEGAHVVLADRDEAGAAAAAGEIESREGLGSALRVRMDVSREEDVRRAFGEAVCAYGGLDILVSNAGIAEAGAIERMPLSQWQRSLDVNATGHFLAVREALRIFREQNLGGCCLFVASKNVPAPGKDFAAYSAAKAAETQLARVAALEAAPLGVRVNVLHPDGIFQDSRLWSEAIRRERAQAHGIGVEQIEEFYRKRNLLQARVLAEDVAEAALFLASDRASKITGAALGVDGGVGAAFPR